MDSLAIGLNHHPKVLLGFDNVPSAANAPILRKRFLEWLANDELDPLWLQIRLPGQHAVGEIIRYLHSKPILPRLGYFYTLFANKISGLPRPFASGKFR